MMLMLLIPRFLGQASNPKFLSSTECEKLPLRQRTSYNVDAPGGRGCKLQQCLEAPVRCNHGKLPYLFQILLLRTSCHNACPDMCELDEFIKNLNSSLTATEVGFTHSEDRGDWRLEEWPGGAESIY